MRKFWFGFLSYPPETGSGSGSPDNSAVPGNDASVTSGSASESLIAAAMASESSTEGTTTESEAAKVAKATGIDITGDTTQPGAKAGAAKPDASGRPGAVETGQAPANRIEAAVRNARAEATATVEAKYAWAKNLDQETVSTAFGIASSLLKDPGKFLRTLAAEEGFEVVPIGGQPRAGVAAQSPAAGTGTFALPKALLRSEDGKGAYDEDQMKEILTNFAAHLEAKFDGRLKPLLSDREAAQKLQEQQAGINEAKQTVTDVMTELRAKPFFQVTNTAGQKVDSPKILEYLLAIPERVRLQNPVAAFYRAYNTYMEKDILPNYGTIAANQVRTENARKAASSSSVRPNAGAGNGDGQPKQLRGVNDLAERMAEMYAAQSAGG